MTACVCGSGLSGGDCCQKIHLGYPASDAQALMRSRYSALVGKNIDHIITTTAPFEQALLDRQALQAWADGTHWTGLDIITHTPKIGKRHAMVHFVAHFEQDGKQGRHQERSYFVQIDQRWYFLDPTLGYALSGKQACACGSGDKFKHCCGKFL